MAMQEIVIQQQFNAPVDVIFDILSDHAQFGDVISTNIKRIADSNTDNINGLGSVRSISIPPTPAFEETITAFEPNKLIEYKITKGSPLKSHTGTMKFSSNGATTTLDYRIVFESKYPIPMLGPIVRLSFEKVLKKGFSQLANGFN